MKEGDHIFLQDLTDTWKKPFEVIVETIDSVDGKIKGVFGKLAIDEDKNHPWMNYTYYFYLEQFFTPETKPLICYRIVNPNTTATLKPVSWENGVVKFDHTSILPPVEIPVMVAGVDKDYPQAYAYPEYPKVETNVTTDHEDWTHPIVQPPKDEHPNTKSLFQSIIDHTNRIIGKLKG